MNSSWNAVMASIKHWEEMVERIKWLNESALMYFVPDPKEISKYLNTDWYARSCPLCRLNNGHCKECPLYRIGKGCNDAYSIWKHVNSSYTFNTFIERAEQLMIPALKEALKWVEENNG